MILTPEQIDSLEKIWQTWYVDIPYEKRGGPIKVGGLVMGPLTTEEVSDEDIADTLAAYADIVQRVAEWEPASWQCICGGVINPDFSHSHAPDCLYLAARKLRGLE